MEEFNLESETNEIRQKNIEEGKLINRYIRTKVKDDKVFNISHVKPVMVQKLQDTLGHILQPNSVIIPYPIRPGLKQRLDNIATQWPNPESEFITVPDAFRAIAPQKILDLAEITMKTSPAATILVLNEGSEENLGFFDGLKFHVTDIEGINYLQITSQLAKLDKNGNLVKDQDGNNVYLDKNLTKTYYSSPYPHIVDPNINRNVEYGLLETEILAMNKSRQLTTLNHTYKTHVTPKHVSPDPSTYHYDLIVDAFAKSYNLSVDSISKLYKGVTAIRDGNWNLTWYGSIEVELDPIQCNNVEGLIEILESIGAGINILKVLSLVSIPWYVMIIIQIIMIEGSYIDDVMEDCVKHDKNGTIGYSVPSGIFYATS